MRGDVRREMPSSIVRRLSGLFVLAELSYPAISIFCDTGLILPQRASRLATTGPVLGTVDRVISLYCLFFPC